jgi:hypothetical protein
MPQPFPQNKLDPFSSIDPMPERTPPRFDTRWLSNLCHLGPRPLLTTGWLRLWLTHHFAAASLLESQEASVQKDLWTPNINTTGIAIESVTKWEPKLTEKRPAIMIKRNTWRRLRVGIGDRMMFTWPIDGQDTWANFWQGSHTLFCMTPGGITDGAEAELLAAEVYRELNQVGVIVRRILNLAKFEVVEVGELMILDMGHARENFVVPITVAYAYQEAWRTLQETQKMRFINWALMQP